MMMMLLLLLRRPELKWKQVDNFHRIKVVSSLVVWQQQQRVDNGDASRDVVSLADDGAGERG